MSTTIVVLKHLTFSILATLFAITIANAQPKSAEPKTEPYTLVYKLKPEYGSTSRVAKAAILNLQQALGKVGAHDVKQKFPGATPPPANARVATSNLVDLSLIYELEYSTEISFEQAKRQLLATGMMEYVEPLYIREPFHQPDDPAADSTKTTQYYLKLINAYAGWEVEKGDTNVVIGILDTGFKLTHSELITKIKYNYADPIDGVDNDNDGYVDNFSGWDFSEKDNDPSSDGSPYRSHGTAVAGLAAGATNNQSGMASVGYNIKFIPLKVFPSTSSGSFRGYEAIVYAADKGCKVINLSWGGLGRSDYEQDVINYAVLNKDVVIIVSGGNTNAELDFYPASYNNVLSVGGTDATDKKHSSFTYSYNIDIAAPSVGIHSLSIHNNNAYLNESGTSFGAPIVSGCAALVRSKFPQLNALQVMERIRATTDDIYALEGNKPFIEKIGKGRLNVKRALKQELVKSVRCTEFAIRNNETPYAGNTVTVDANFLNYLSPTSNLVASITSVSPYVTIEQGETALGSISTMAAANNYQQPFIIKISEDTPLNTMATLRVGFTDGTYTDYQYFKLYINPEFVTLSTSELQVTLNSKGNLGYNGFNFKQGVGVKYKNKGSLLYEGGLMIASTPNRVSNNIRDENYRNDGDFTTTLTARLKRNTPLADLEARSVMHDDTAADDQVGVEVKHISYAWNDESYKDFVVLEYHIKNITSDTLENLYTGLFADWDIGEYYSNSADWNDSLNLGYVYNATTPQTHAGIKLLTYDAPVYYAIDNIIDEGEYKFNIEDGFTKAEKYTTLSGGVARTKAGTATGGNNVSHVVGAASGKLAPGATKIVAFALLTADNLDDLKKNAAVAQAKYKSFRTGPVPLAMADTACIGSNITWAPEGGTTFNFYADSAKKTYLGTGSQYTLEGYAEPTTIYAANADSLFESNVAPAAYALPIKPAPDFTFGPNKIYPGTPVEFDNQSLNGINWQWTIEGDEFLTKDKITHAFDRPGEYEVKLIGTDRFGCTDTAITKTVKVLETSPEAIAEVLKFYPNPASGYVHIDLLSDGVAGKFPEIDFMDATGKIAPAKVEYLGANEAEVNLRGMAPGIYIIRINYSNTSLIKRIVVLNN